MKSVIMSIELPGSLVKKTGIFDTEEYKNGICVGRKTKFIEKELVNSIATKQIKLDEKAISFMISREGMPASISKKIWSKLSEKRRLKIHLDELSEGSKYTFKMV